MKFHWGVASSIMSLIANCNRDEKKRRDPYEPNDFNPFMIDQPKEKKVIRVGIEALKVFLPGWNGG